MRDKLAQLWHQRAKLTRADIFGSHNARLRPIVVPSQVDICVPGMVGPDYQAGGPVIVSVNPAAGRDGFRPTSGDTRLYAAAEALRTSFAVDRPSEDACARFIRETGSQARLTYFTRKHDAHSERKRVLAELASLYAKRAG